MSEITAAFVAVYFFIQVTVGIFPTANNVCKPFQSIVNVLPPDFANPEALE